MSGSQFGGHYGLGDGGVVHVGLGRSTQEWGEGEVASSLVFWGEGKCAGSGIFTFSILTVRSIFFIITCTLGHCMADVGVASGSGAGVQTGRHGVPSSVTLLDMRSLEYDLAPRTVTKIHRQHSLFYISILGLKSTLNSLYSLFFHF